MSTATGKPVGHPAILVNPQNNDLFPLLKALQQPLLPKVTQLLPSCQSVIQLFAGLSPEQLVGHDAGNQLRDSLQRIGMNLEAQLARGDKNAARASLKAVLLEMTASSQKNEELASSAQKILSTREMYQVAQLKLQGDLIIFPLPFSFLENGFLVVTAGRR